MNISKRYWARLLLGVAVVAVAGACGTTDQDVDPVTIENALEAIADDLGLAEDGGAGDLDDTKEEPAFGNEDFARAFDDAVERDMGEDETDVRGNDAAAFNVLVVWGRIRPQDDVSPTRVRWNPTLSVMEGDGVRVRRTLRFERGDRVHPQTSRNEVQISSVTGAGVDGVVVRIAISGETGDRTERGSSGDDAFFRFESRPFSVDVPVRELADLSQSHVIDDTGNGLMLVAVQRPPQPCAHGFMGGRWAQTRNNGGVFGGVWRNENGQRLGFVAGRWGATAAGGQVFHGKVINRQGEFLGFVAGSYGQGAYAGEILGRRGNLLGLVRGRYAGADGGGHGLFRGVWQQVCESDEPEVCDGEDNDSDGRIDEGVTNACGECGAIGDEVCDGEDNDCDNEIDEGLTNACGECGRVPDEVCDGEDNDCDNEIDEGVTNACGTCGEVPDEVCDGQDNDCDNEIDEGVTNACGTCGEVPDEVCDGQDNDCDNEIDEGVTNACGTCGRIPIERCDGLDNDCDDAIDEGVCVIGL